MVQWSLCHILVPLCRVLLEALPAAGQPGGPQQEAPPSANLSNGLLFPLIGLGCSSGLRRPDVRSALELGYRHLDTAQAFQWGYNETEVGLAVRDSQVPRASLFLQSKIFPEDLGYVATKRAFKRSLERLQTDYLDSMLIHKPRCWVGACTREPEGTWQESWKALEDLYEAGLVRAIGICDVDDQIMDDLAKQNIQAHIVQNWMDPFHQDKHIRERCREAGIQYQGYSTLGPQWVHFRGHKENPVLADPKLQEIARAHAREVAQVVLNWAVTRSVAVIPASRRPERQRSNLESFDFKLSEAELAAIDALDGALEASEEAVVEFHNRGASQVDLFFIGPTGEQLIGSIAPGASLGQNTYHGHQWRIKRGGLVIHGFTVDARGGGRHQSRVVGSGDGAGAPARNDL
uniref:NADP-dependent oxidoreductase domain-containing protein n=1 Tax=Alexandrium monilatum TaxID=311494 RepID=A0A7S4Q063_9DINO